MTRTAEDIAAQIRRMEIHSRDSRFDAQMRSMFRRTIRSLKVQLSQVAA